MKTSPWRRAVHRVRTTTAATRHALTHRGRRIRHWAFARRRTALSQMLRGACFGSGSGLITLTIYWLTRR
ncbi:hypothetical protein [Streptomyces sp. KN37]|uniref:hypothetical protein n=1 Tax=Streptomyces sp. KN37 TaxID=3090667 RepID=UPI002A74CF10|nr:hypothetical protein [Streptomyces sp. KN37]WPO76726.1 hypothetical protein R9806_39580 [Streptomyces sp. KN37]